MNHNQSNRLLNKQELAEEINQPPTTINKLRRERKIPAIRIGYRSYRYNLAKVLRALSRLEIKSPE
jgi:hypothetical protein